MALCASGTSMVWGRGGSVRRSKSSRRLAVPPNGRRLCSGCESVSGNSAPRPARPLRSESVLRGAPPPRNTCFLCCIAFRLACTVLPGLLQRLEIVIHVALHGLPHTLRRQDASRDSNVGDSVCGAGKPR